VRPFFSFFFSSPKSTNVKRRPPLANREPNFADAEGNLPNQPCLIIVEPMLLNQWYEQVHAFYLPGAVEVSRNAGDALRPGARIVLVSNVGYEFSAPFAAAMLMLKQYGLKDLATAQPQLSLLAVDEHHVMRNNVAGGKECALIAKGAPAVIGATATPLCNSLKASASAPVKAEWEY
jgi:hypothetical protein